ncbi:MAG: exosome complex exonuclease Rrp41 [Candidatus Marsarchaeota archaeon]|nr:exosome complex exonuclease Rrp41 [Candidatus Marsarchaeota archaeon]MCL5106473.1 exosome complex exonuclease Rrp41 [Candidatus Marsarchaeota archaeon]
MLNKPELLRGDGKRLDGRDLDELRPLSIKANVLKNAAGSAYAEWGNNKVLAAVYGPKEVVPRHLLNPERAVIKCRYAMAPFSSLSDHGRSGPNRRAIEISKVTKEVFDNVVLLDEFPETAIELSIEILQSDGGTRAAGITTAAVALANAGIPMKDLVYSVSAGKIKDKIILDLNMIEDNYSDADMPVAVSPRTGNMLLLQMDGELTRQEFNLGLETILEAGKQISKIQRQALIDVYE